MREARWGGLASLVFSERGFASPICEQGRSCFLHSLSREAGAYSMRMRLPHLLITLPSFARSGRLEPSYPFVSRPPELSLSLSPIYLSLLKLSQSIFVGKLSRNF
ncbi:hypothetical protein Q3G72_002696 [Acer saccharum]|nr:hypothetical protein Q3G72_002696 [Acer saccharum]